MLILHSQRAIFVRCRKTASTSLEIELSKHARADDVITSFCQRDELLRRDHYGIGPQNTRSQHRDGEFFNHMSAQEISDLVDPATWSSYYKFCVERNPWDKVVSMYQHRMKRRSQEVAFRDFILSGEFKEARNIDLYTIDGKVAVDYVAKYEDLDFHLDVIFRQIGLSYKGLSAKAKSQFRAPGHYQEFFDTETKNIVATTFSDEIALHGYTFENDKQ